MNILNKIFNKTPLKTSGHGAASNHVHNYETNSSNSNKSSSFRESLEVKYPISDYVGKGKRFTHANQYSHMITKKMEGFHNMINTPVADPREKNKQKQKYKKKT